MMNKPMLVEGVQVFGVRVTASSGAAVVRCSPGVQSYRVRTRAGVDLGELHGLVLEPKPDAGLAFEGSDLVVDGSIEDVETFERNVLDLLQGSFLVLTGGPLPARLYPDCGATLPIVYCQASRRAASSAGMLLEGKEYQARLLEGRHSRLIAEREGECWIPGALTAHDGVLRLLPNHYLDVETWRAVRFWPREGEFRQDVSVDAAATIVAERLVRFMQSAERGARRIGLAMTAGYDSRLLIAAARAAEIDFSCFTLDSTPNGLDQIMAGEISRSLGAKHRLVPIVGADAAGQAAWDRAVGHTIRHGNRRHHPSLRQLEYGLILTGILGETGRARLYRKELTTINDQRITPESLLSRMGMPRDAELLADAEAWLAPLSWLPGSVVLDLAVLERFYMPLWRPAQSAITPELMPLVDRAIQTAFLSTPPQAKGTETLFRECIRRLCSDALKLPINSFGDYRDPLRMLRKLMEPARLRRFVRSRFA